MISPREARAIIRKAKKRVPHGEDISHLNITAMMDMMTILVVFLIKSIAVGNPPPSDITLPQSTTTLTAEEAIVLTITKTSIVVEGRGVVDVRNGNVDANAKTKGADGVEIAALRQELEGHGKRIRTIQKLKGIDNGDEPLEISVVADRGTPFRLLHEVLYTAGLAKFGKFRLVVLKPPE